MSNFFFQWIQVWTQCKDWERMDIYEIALLCEIFWELGKKSQKQPTKKPRAYWQFLSHLLSMSGLVLHFSFLPHCRFSVNYQKSVGDVKHPFIPYQHDCMSTNLAVGFCGRPCGYMLWCLLGVSWSVLAEPVSSLTRLSYWASDLSLESCGSKSNSADLFFLLINKPSCFSCSQCIEWGWGGAFQQCLSLLRRWQHAFLRLHRDTLGCGLELCRQLLWVTVPVECALNSSFEERPQVVELQTCHGSLLKDREVREGSGAACCCQHIYSSGAVLDLLLLESWLPF